MFEHSGERALLVEKLATDFAFADVLCKLHYAANEQPPTFCGNELTRIWHQVQEHRLNWFERQIVFGRIELMS